jgi:hypothetical protein
MPTVGLCRTSACADVLRAVVRELRGEGPAGRPDAAEKMVEWCLLVTGMASDSQRFEPIRRAESWVWPADGGTVGSARLF